ncbi:MAG TPA: phenylalanine--tRNA ligase subunit alpha [Atribacteraceae bacterium]|nr:phenylalanine--tRNA ligase subunit alpha [Atribacteraceae bacterium]
MEALNYCLDEFQKALREIGTLDDLNRIKGRFIGRKGALNNLLKTLKTLPEEQKRETGRRINKLKEHMEQELTRVQSMLDARKSRGPAIDLTLPGRSLRSGSLHPILSTMDTILDVFQSLGFRIEEGPEIETDYYNFKALNFPPDHPARDEQDSFFLEKDYLLRTHTSPVQIRTMEKLTPPLKVVVPGRCYRRDAVDATHSLMFHQVEGLVVAPGISMGHLKGTLEVFARRVFGPDRQVRFRPSFFPFTEPSAEVDISCGVCRGNGCRSCGQSGWLEIMGAGLVHPHVFHHVGYDSEKVRGFAFGMGVERITMLKYHIPDMRWFYENDLAFLDQFRIV